MATIPRPLLVGVLLGILAGCSQPTEKFVDVDVGGHHLHLLILGQDHPGPSVILESGLGGIIAWQNVRSQIAQFAQVVTYDRAGNGASQPGPQPRDAKTIAAELHTALHQAGIAPPYVLVGQSLGGLYVQVFAATYPDETAALVLVDPTPASPDLCLPADQVNAWFMTHQPGDWPRIETATRNAPDGLRSFLACKYMLMETFIETFPEPRRSPLRTEWWAAVNKLLGPAPSWELAGGAHDEAQIMSDSIRQALAARPLPKVPTLLLASGKTDLDALPPEATTPNILALQAQATRWKISAFQNWIDQTPGAKLILVPDSGHNIEAERPQAVIDAVREALR